MFKRPNRGKEQKMKRTFAVTCLAAVMAMAGGVPAMAHNGNRSLSAGLGFLGGVIFGQAIDCHPRTVYYQPAPVYYAPAPVVIQQPVVYAQPQYVEQAPVVVQAPSGHYEFRDEQQWIPGNWRYEEIGPNTYRKTWTPGYYRTIRTKVWVSDIP